MKNRGLCPNFTKKCIYENGFAIENSNWNKDLYKFYYVKNPKWCTFYSDSFLKALELVGLWKNSLFKYKP